MAAMGNFPKPIMHGLGSYGFTTRAVYETYCKGAPERIYRVGGRFTSHVFPGETYLVDMWKEGDFVIFATRTKERGKVVLTGFIELKPAAKL